jgi:hypothetical protein
MNIFRHSPEEQRKIPSGKPSTSVENKGLTSGQTIEFTYTQTAKKCPVLLRHIGYRDVETCKRLFLTNNFELAAKRSQIELFFSNESNKISRLNPLLVPARML